MNEYEYNVLQRLEKGEVLTRTLEGDAYVWSSEPQGQQFGQALVDEMRKQRWLGEEDPRGFYGIGVMGLLEFKQARWERYASSLERRGLNFTLDGDRVFLFTSGETGLCRADIERLIVLLQDTLENLED